MPSGQDKIRLKDVAAAAGVSQGTASNAFNKPELVRPGLRAKVLETAARLGYEGPNPLGRMLRTGRAGALGVMFADAMPYAFSDPAAIATLRGIAEECARHAVNLTIISAASHDQALHAVDTAAVDGFIVHCLDGGSALADAAARRGLPVVALDIDPPAGHGAVTIDDFGGARRAAARLLDLGHRQVAVLSLKTGGDPHLDDRAIDALPYRATRERLKGYRAAWRAAGRDPATLLCHECRNDPSAAAAAVATLLRDRPELTGILAMSDVLALGAVAALRAAGRAVPAEISVIGFDGLAEAGHADPPLTTVAQPLEEKGRCAAAMALSGSRRRVVLETTLIDGATAAAPGATRWSR